MTTLLFEPPPPAPDHRSRAVLLGLLLTAMLLIAPPQPFAHAASDVTRGAAPGAAPGAAAGAAARLASAPGPGRSWPVGGRSGLLQRFAAPPAPWAAGHRGVDLAASAGTTVRAAAPGVVSFSGVVAGRPVVTVTHPGSGSPPLRTTYLPVTGSLPVGTPVGGGEPIGELAPGAGHCASGCLHWGLLRGQRYLDPLALLGTGQARLLPLSGPAASTLPGSSAALRMLGHRGRPCLRHAPCCTDGFSGCRRAWP